MIAIIDNYDSFTYNLVQYLGELGAELRVMRNDTVTVDEIRAARPSAIVISPGPGRPEQAGVTMEVIRVLGDSTPILGVCLGHQAIGAVFGGVVERAIVPMHGKTSTIEHDGCGVFTGIDGPFVASRYHSLVVADDRLPAALVVTARTVGDRTIMGLRHRTQPIHGVQFHPESILTIEGKHILRNFVEPDEVMFSELIEKLTRQEDLSSAEAATAMAEVMAGRATPAQLAGLLVGLVMKGERPAEIVGLARAMRAHAVPLSRPYDDVFDTCGTGGDRSGTFNISSCAAIVVAAAGVRVAKHGNRSVSSKSGSADVFEALGVNLSASPAVVERCLDEAKIGFFFAPTFHPSMRHAAQTRRELGVRTAFNFLGPLTNPAGATRQLVGVPRPEYTELLARALMLLGSTRAWVVHGADGIDEISTTGYTKISECRNGSVNTFYLHPADAGLPKTTPESLRGGDARQNAAIATRVLSGELGPPRDVVLLNAGAALFIAEAATSLKDGIAAATAAINRGDATRTLHQMVTVSGAAPKGPDA